MRFCFFFKMSLPDRGNSFLLVFCGVFLIIKWIREWQSTAVFLPGESMDGGAWWAAVHGITQSWTHVKRLSIVQS